MNEILILGLVAVAVVIVMAGLLGLGILLVLDSLGEVRRRFLR